MNSIRLFSLAVVLLASSRVGAEPAATTGATALERGIQLYERGLYDEAIAELESAHREEPNAEVCYALGQALRKKDECTKAIPYFRCAVEKTRSEVFARAARYQIGRCVLEGADQTQPIRQNSAPSGVSSSSSTAEAGGRRLHWWRDAAGASLVGIGLGGALAGVVLLAHAESLARSSSDDLQAYRAAGAVGPERIGGIVALAIGGSLVVGGVIRYAVRARRLR